MRNAYTEAELALIDNIHLSPHNDAPRLAYADWLEQHDAKTYAEFIRLQCHQPYIGLSWRNPYPPTKSLSWDFPWDDKTAQNRLDRMLSLLPDLYDTERFASLAPLPFYAEYFRGLPLLEIEEGDWSRDDRVFKGGGVKLPPLARVCLSLHTPSSQLAEWLNHPLMVRVDELRVWLHSTYEGDDGDEDDDGDEETVEFDVAEISELASAPLIDRLRVLNLCAPISLRAMPLVAQLLKPRVFVDTSYG
jgi:uncharacterized protein (TIGR02996 family)